MLEMSEKRKFYVEYEIWKKGADKYYAYGSGVFPCSGKLSMDAIRVIKEKCLYTGEDSAFKKEQYYVRIIFMIELEE